MNIAIVLISDPQAGTEALARAFNALAIAAESKAAGDTVEINFIGTGTRWPAELSKLGHPANGVYDTVRECVVGASRACAAAFGATAGLQACGIMEKSDLPLEGTEGLLSLRRYLEEDWKILIF